MKRSVITTNDGSKTIRLEEWNEHYHSTHGAIQEALHVYIGAGLDFFLTRNQAKSIRVLEAGFGTGLNALLTCKWAQEHGVSIDYLGVEAYPINDEEKNALDYFEAVKGVDVKTIFEDLHSAEWEQWVQITKELRLNKMKSLFSDLALKPQANVVFYDAFGPRVQPELWDEKVLKKFYEAMLPGGVFVTYCVKGTAKRCLQSMGFEVNIIKGPPGKRHMMRAIKPI